MSPRRVRDELLSVAGRLARDGETQLKQSPENPGRFTPALEKWPGTRLQRCVKHKSTNLLEHCPAHARREVERDYDRIVCAKDGRSMS